MATIPSACKVSVVLPVLNEAANLPHVLNRIPEWIYEVILVDGQSSDDSVAVAKQTWNKRFPRVTEMERWSGEATTAPRSQPGNWPALHIVQQFGRGKGAALTTGFHTVRGDIVVMIDADGSTDPAEIPAFLGALLSGADFAKGSRFLQGGGTADMPLHRQVGNGLFVKIVRLLFGGRYTDLCYGFNAFWRWTLPILDLDGPGFEIETMMNVRALQAGLKIAEVPSFESRRIYGEGRLRTVPDGWRVLKTIVREWRSPRAKAGDWAQAERDDAHVPYPAPPPPAPLSAFLTQEAPIPFQSWEADEVNDWVND